MRLSTTEADRQFGPAVWSDENFVMRAKTDDMGSLHVVVHRKEGGQERIPVGYIEGISALTINV